MNKEQITEEQLRLSKDYIMVPKTYNNTYLDKDIVNTELSLAPGSTGDEFIDDAFTEGLKAWLIIIKLVKKDRENKLVTNVVLTDNYVECSKTPEIQGDDDINEFDKIRRKVR